MARVRGKGAGAGGEREGRRLRAAVERIVEPPERIRARVEALRRQVRGGLPPRASEEQVRRALEERLIAAYSNRTAMAGGAAALPGLLPGVGTVVAALGGGLADMTLCLKFEVEMVLALAAARGLDIEDPRERQLAYLLAVAHTYEASGGDSPLADLLRTEADALWSYTPRQVGKLVTTLFVRLALVLAGRGLVKAVPLVGVLVSGATNKALTRRVGHATLKAFEGRPSASPADARARPARRAASSGEERRPPAPRRRRAGARR